MQNYDHHAGKCIVGCVVGSAICLCHFPFLFVALATAFTCSAPQKTLDPLKPMYHLQEQAEEELYKFQRPLF